MDSRDKYLTGGRYYKAKSDNPSKSYDIGSRAYIELRCIQLQEIIENAMSMMIEMQEVCVHEKVSEAEYEDGTKERFCKTCCKPME